MIPAPYYHHPVGEALPQESSSKCVQSTFITMKVLYSKWYTMTFNVNGDV
jgi:hypothetical protein